MNSSIQYIDRIKRLSWELVSNPENYLQLAAALVLLGFAKFISLSIKKYIRNRTSVNTQHRAVRAALKLITPTIATLFFLFGAVACREFFGAYGLIFAIAKISFAFLLIKLITAISDKKAAGIFLSVVIFPVLFLSVCGILHSTISYLDSLSFEVGKAHVSVYMIIKGIFVLSLLIWLTKIISHSTERRIRKLENFDYSTRELFVKAANVLLYAFVFMVTLNVIGVDLTALAVFSGAIGVGIGLGLQKIASNFITGIVLLMEKSIKVGDIIELEGSNPIIGVVKNLDARSLLLERFDGREVLIPNEDIITTRVTNWTYSNTRGRIEIKVSVAYGTDLRKAKRLLLEAANTHERCVKEPAAECFLTDFGENSINLVLYFWVDDVVKGRSGPKSDVMLEIVDKFKANGITIPLPQLDLHLIKEAS